MKRVALLALVIAAPLLAQRGDSTAGRGRGAGRGGGGGWDGAMDSARIRQLYVSKTPSDLRGCVKERCDRDLANKHRTDSIYAARAAGSYEFQKIKYKSRVDGLEIPAYLFSPINKGSGKHAALVWVHGGVHGDWDTGMFPFVVEAVKRGYVVLTPDYRGSTGYGDEWMKKIDYGGKEVDDVVSSVDYLATLAYVDTQRMGIMGWSHGGFITSHILFRGDGNPFKAGAAIVPVTNLVFRLSDHGPGYARDYAAEEGIQGLPFERNCGPKHDRDCIDIYLERSPVFHAENLKVPMLVHVATNDCDVFFRENQQMVYTLRALKPNLAETKIYKDPPPGPAGCGHTFSRRVNRETLEREDSPEQIDSWNLTWAFFQKNLKP
jgi:dipeptidyl aminopeptidase/acylaminoacyl peptidase